MKPSGNLGRSLWLAPALALLSGCVSGPQVPVRAAGPAAAPLSLTMVHAHARKHGIAVTGVVRSRDRNLHAVPGSIRIAALRADGAVAAAQCVRWGPIHRRTWSWAPFTADLPAADPAAIQEVSVGYAVPADC